MNRDKRMYNALVMATAALERVQIDGKAPCPPLKDHPCWLGDIAKECRALLTEIDEAPEPKSDEEEFERLKKKLGYDSF